MIVTATHRSTFLNLQTENSLLGVSRLWLTLGRFVGYVKYKLKKLAMSEACANLAELHSLDLRSGSLPDAEIPVFDGRLGSEAQ
jgi:hypothetical protein